MKVVLQRVSSASVQVAGEIVGTCQEGFCALVGVEANDTAQTLQKMADKIIHLRVFEDENHKMNKSILDINGSLLLVSQFTLLAEYTSRRPSFTKAGDPKKAKELFEQFRDMLLAYNIPVETGVFGADMLVQINNQGPATFILESSQI